MYDLYPDWGPAKHRADEPTMGSGAHPASPPSLDRRDGGAQRPDDN